MYSTTYIRLDLHLVLLFEPFSTSEVENGKKKPLSNFIYDSPDAYEKEIVWLNIITKKS